MYILFVVFSKVVQIIFAIGVKRKRRGVYIAVELTTILGEFNEWSLQLFGENDRKAAVLEVELELKKEGNRSNAMRREFWA